MNAVNGVIADKAVAGLLWILVMHQYLHELLLVFHLSRMPFLLRGAN